MHNPIPWSALPLQPLRGTRILSLTLNLPGPAALKRCIAMGAQCTKLEPPPPGSDSADPVQVYCEQAYNDLHAQVQLLYVDLQTPAGQTQLHAELARSDVLLTSFRPAALRKLGLDWELLQARYPQLSMVRIFGATADAAETPSHGAEHLPAGLQANMTGALMASEAILQTQMHRLRCGAGALLDIGLLEAAQWLAQPLDWGLSTDVGSAHADYHC